MKLFAVELRRILEVLCLQDLQKKVRAQFHDLCVQKWSCLPWNSDSFWKFSPFKLYKKVLSAFSRFMCPNTKLFAVEFRRILEVLCPQVLQKKILGAIPRFVRPRTKLLAVKFRRILEVLCPRVLQKKLWVQFHDLCIQKRSCLPWNSDAFKTFSACKV